MKKANPHRTQTQKGRRLVLLRYASPTVALLLTLISLFVPCLRYTTSDTGTGKVNSLVTQLGYTWDSVRQFLFGAGELSAVNEKFAQVVFALILVSVLLFLVGATATVWASVGALLHFRDGREEGTARALYVTLFPNRTVTLLWQALILPLLAFPRLLVLCYDRVLYYPVILNVTFPEPLLIGGILFLVTVVLSFVTFSRERESGMSPYRETRREKKKEQSDETNEARSFFSAPAEEELSEIERNTREEQAERIRALLTKREENGENHDNDE